MIFYVYGLIDPTTNKCFYIGKGSKDRMCRHMQKVKRGASTDNPHLDRKLAKMLRNGIDIRYVKYFENLTEDIAYKREDEKIREVGIENLCNVWYGGQGGRVPTEETRQKIRKNRKGIPVSADTRQKMRQSKLGGKQTEAHRRNRSLALKGKPQTNKQKEANSSRSASMMGRKFTEEHRQKLSEAKKRNPTRYWLGKSIPDEMKQRISRGVKKTLEQPK